MSIRARLPCFAFLAFFSVAACGPRDPVAFDDAGTPPPVPAITSMTPDAGAFNDKVQVTLTTDKPATIFVTKDGSDPLVESAARTSGENNLSFELKQTTTLKFFSRTAQGADEPVQTAQLFRAGGRKGTISGVVVVDTIALNRTVAVFADQEQQVLGTVSTKQELPFLFENLETGTIRLRARSDRDGDGNFFPVLDDGSTPVDVTLDLTDPFKASAENVRLYLGAPVPGTCAIQGVITHPTPVQGETIRVSALSQSAFGMSGDPTALLSQLQNGYLLLVDPEQTEYPYAVNDLEPGSYVISPALTTLGTGGLSINFIAHPLQQTSCSEGMVGSADFEFGPVALSGAITLQPATPPSQGFVYGVIAARNASFSKGLQIVLMPVVFAQVPNSTDYAAGYAGRALRSNSSFPMRIFTNLDSMNPIADALAWSINVFGGAPPHVTVQTTTTDATENLTVTVP